MRRVAAVLARAGAAIALVSGVILAGGLPASAEAPPTLSGEITDHSGVLGNDTATVQAALDRLAKDTPYQLYVVFVPDFSGTDPLTWTQQAAKQSGLGSRDFVLAVATSARRYMLAPSSSGSITSAEVQQVASKVEDQLRTDSWAQAAVTAADGLRSAAGGGGSSTGTTATSNAAGTFGVLLVVGLIVIVVIAIIAGVVSRNRRRALAGPMADTAGSTRVATAADEYAQLPTAELDRRSASALVGLDDALRSSEQELGFAQAEFGPDATREFEKVLADGKQQITEAFRLRQTLDDDVPDTEAQVRATSAQILRLCAQVSAALNAQKDDFDRLRDLEAHVGDALDGHERAVATLRSRIEPTRTTLAALASRYPASALASVTTNPDQASHLLDDVAATLATGRQALASGDRGAAVGYARAAQTALDQAITLLDAVDSAGKDLAAAGSRLDAAIASITGDLSDAARLAPGDLRVAPAATEASAAVAAAQAARAGDGDPLAALRRIAAAEATLDAALAPSREQDEANRRALGLLDQTLGRLDSALRATTDYVDTRRGAVGPEARTRLAEGQRLRDQAVAQRQTDVQGALATAQRAEQLVAEAGRIAQDDVERSDDQRGGPWGGGRGGGGNLGGMILGGILIDSILRGGGGWGHGGGGWGGDGGGWGGGGDGGGFGGGGFGGGFGGGGDGGGF